MMPRDNLQYALHELVRGGREIWLSRIYLGFDIEPKVSLRRQLKNFVQRWDSRARYSLLPRKPWISRPAIPLAQLCQRGFMNRRLGLRALADWRTEDRVVRNDNDTVAGHAHIQLQHVNALCDRILERRDRVLRTQSACSPVPVHLDAISGHQLTAEQEGQYRTQ